MAVLPDSGSPKNMNLTILPRPLVVGLFSANFCAREFILFFFFTNKRDAARAGKDKRGGNHTAIIREVRSYL